MMKTNSSQQRMKDKARAAMEPGLVATKPQVAVKKSNDMRERAMIAKERPIGLKSGGSVRRYAEGGDVENPKGMKVKPYINQPSKPKPEVREAKSGGSVHSEKGEKKADIAQDKKMIARHNRLMHPGQKSKLAKGGAAKYAAGGAAKVRHGVATPSGAPKPQPRNKNPAYR